MIRHDIAIELSSNTPLEVITALVAFCAQELRRHVQLAMTPRLREVLKESAHLDMEHLELEGDVAVIESEPSCTSINFRGNGTRIDPGLPTQAQLRLAEHCLVVEHVPDNIFAHTNKCHSERNRVIASVQSTTALLIGTGPSLRSIDLSQYQGCLTIACNKIHLLPYDFEPKHLVFEDRVVTQDVFSQRASFGQSEVWLPSDLSYLLPSRAVVYPLDRRVHSFPSFSPDPNVAFSGWTVMYVMLQLAFWMGARTAYLLGVDGYRGRPPSIVDRGVFTSTGIDDQHFHPLYYGPGQRFQAHQPQRVLAAYRLADQVYRDAGRAIINCSVGSHVDAFIKGTLPPPEVLT